MTEFEAYFQLALILGISFCIPLFWEVGRGLAKFVIYKFFPPKITTIKIKKLNGDIGRIRVVTTKKRFIFNTVQKLKGIIK